MKPFVTKAPAAPLFGHMQRQHNYILFLLVTSSDLCLREHPTIDHRNQS